jgi:DNA-binding transcriptional LysR family regulator
MKQNFTVRQGALDGVEAFLGVAQHRNFRKAAAELGVTPSAISQAVRALEARIGAALFIRTTRSVGLTEAGERFFSRAKPAFEELVAASEVARDLGQRPAGRLRLTVPRAVVPILLDPLIASFCQAYPEVEVEIAASPDLVDIAAEGFDAGIRQGQFIKTDMIAVRLTPSFPLAVVGSPDYLRLPAHAPLERVDRALVLCQRQRGRRSHRFRTFYRQRHSHGAWRGRRRIGPCTGARADRRRTGSRWKTCAGAGAVRADAAGGVSLLSQPPSNDAETASLHRSRDEPFTGNAACQNESFLTAQAIDEREKGIEPSYSAWKSSVT